MVLDLGTGQVNLSSFSWGEHASGTGAAQTDVNLGAAAGAHSAGVLGAVLGGKSVPEIVLTIRDSLGHVVERWRFENVMFSAYQTSAAAGGGGPFDTFSMSAQTVELIYSELAPAAAVAPPAPAARTTPVDSLTIRFSEPVTGLDLKDLLLSRDSTPIALTASQTLTTSDGGRTWVLGNLTPLDHTDGTYALTVQTGAASLITGAVSGQLLALASAAAWTLDRVPPAVVSAAYDYNAPTPRLRVIFSEDVSASLASGDLILKLLSGNAPLPAVGAVTYDVATNTAVFTFAGPLPDGNYRAILPGDSVTDAAGNRMAGDFSFDFFVLAGDANRDRKVDFNDLVVLAQNYHSTGGKTFAQGDFNYDGNVDFNDLVILAQRYNTGLAAPAPAAPLALAVATPPASAAVSSAPSKRSKNGSAAKPIFSVTPVVRAPARPKATAARRR
jgi:hypothetical protein